MKSIKAPVFLLASLVGLAAVSEARADDEVDRILERFDHEPKIRETQVAAINYYNVSPEKIGSLRTRTRTKALVPGLSVGFVNSVSSFNKAVDDIIFRNVGIAIFEEQNADFIGFTASASWSLDRLVFNAEELDVMSLIGIQDGLQREVTALYYVRRRLQIELLLNPPKTLEGRLSGRLRLEELTGLLDAYTGGFFSDEIARNLKSRRRDSSRTSDGPIDVAELDRGVERAAADADSDADADANADAEKLKMRTR